MIATASPVKRLSSCQQASRRLRRNYLKQIRNREYQRLRAIVPAIANKKKVSKVTVIEEAVRYIDELHMALMSKLMAKGLNMTQVQMTLASQLEQRMATAHQSSSPSFCQKLNRPFLPCRPPQPKSFSS